MPPLRQICRGEGRLFARKKISCACEYTIDMRTDRLTSRTCPHCGNVVVFDQSKGRKVRYPVCGEPINTQAEQSKTLLIAKRANTASVPPGSA